MTSNVGISSQGYVGNSNKKRKNRNKKGEEANATRENPNREESRAPSGESNANAPKNMLKNKKTAAAGCAMPWSRKKINR